MSMKPAPAANKRARGILGREPLNAPTLWGR
jgi:hypothetical protein